MNKQVGESKDDLDLQNVLAAAYRNPVLRKVQDCAEMFAIVTDIEQGLATLQQIINSEKLSPQSVKRLQIVQTDGVSLLTACIAFGSVAKAPQAILLAADGWILWIEGMATELAQAKAESN